jgi:hypothetical protein
MGLLSWLTGKGSTDATKKSPASSGTGEPSDIFSRIVHVQSGKLAGISSQSPNRRFTIAWLDGGPDQARTGRHLLLAGDSGSSLETPDMASAVNATQ